eukprot:gb/GEZJ01001527.1/.p1 GENE.gb/GEZJ01001527.1/~~gb/GEZJ01001527.1/.p1  ORF type:complete len:385 (+),score=41.58 gb/GEZJ01001527.1/:82-1155(+)
MRRVRRNAQSPSTAATATASDVPLVEDEQLRSSIEAMCDSVCSPLSPTAWQAVQHALDAAQSDPFGDGDQSALASLTFHPLRKAWATGLDARDIVLTKSASRNLHRAAWDADVKSVHALIRAAREKLHRGHSNALTHLLERRLSNLRLPPLHYACFSARSRSYISERDTNNYVAVVHALCRAGARVDSRDIAGYTPLSIASSFLSNPTTLRMARVLVAYGADPNATTRFGEPIIVSSIIGANTDAFATLLRAGVDLTIPDRTGVSTREMASKWPVLEAVVTQVQRERAVSDKICDVCGRAGVTKFCASCQKVYYCSRECQRDGWRAGHRERCTTASCVPSEHDITSPIISDKDVPSL